MKKIFLYILLCTVLLISGCGKQATSTDESNNNEEVTENVTKIAIEKEPVTKSEDEILEEIIVVDESEMKYQELLAKYENTPYKNPNKLEYIPRVGEKFNFSFCDTINNIEDIGGYQDYPEGYFVLHFSTDANDY